MGPPGEGQAYLDIVAPFEEAAVARVELVTLPQPGPVLQSTASGQPGFQEWISR